MLTWPELTKHNKKMTLTIAFNYGGRIEIADAVKQIVEEAKAGNLKGKVTRPHHPNQRRAAPEQLPPLASRLQRALVHPSLLARLRERTPLRSHTRLPKEKPP